MTDGFLRFRFAGECRYATLDKTLIKQGQWDLVTVEEPVAGDFTRKPGCRVEGWCPRGDSNTRHAV